MSDSTDRDPVEELAAEFAERYRNGDKVSIEDYATKHPELADDIRDLFPTIEAMERLSTKRVVDAAMQDRSKPKQLGDFRIIDEIARGGMGIVYEAEQVSLDRRVAVKILPSHAFSREKDVRRFYREAKTAASLHHSNIVPVFGVGEENGQHYIVMQLIRGVGLDEVLTEIKRVFVEGESSDGSSTSASRFNAVVRSAANLVESDLHEQSTGIEAHAVEDTVEIPKESAKTAKRLIKPTTLRASLGRDYFRNVAKIGLQAAQALDYAHDHETLHRDIKPGNLILDEDGRVWVADFGLAKIVADNDVTRSGDIVGTIAYVAPERFEGETTKRSDIYSLGVTLHEMLTLQKAFTGLDRVEVLHQVTKEGITRPSKLNRSVPRDLETIVMKAVASSPADRYKSAGALARDLEAFLEDRPIEARRLSYLEYGVRWCRRNQLVSAMACGIILLVASVIGLLASGYHKAESQRLRAELMADEAIGFIDGIYDHFAPTTIGSDALADSSMNEGAMDELGNEPRETPISKDTAVMLENLLAFYDSFADDSTDTNQVAVKRISASRRVGDLHRRLDQRRDAKLSYEEAVKRIEALPAVLRQTEAMRVETARVYNGLGLSDSDGATEAHRSARDVLSDAGSSDEKLELATTLYLLHAAESRERFHRSRWNKGRKQKDDPKTNSLRLAKKILSDLLKESPQNADCNFLLAKCLLFERGFRGERSDSPDRQRGVEILTSLVEQHPDRPKFQFELGDVYLRKHAYLFGHAWGRKRERTEQEVSDSAKELEKVLVITADLEVSHPNIPKYYQLKKGLNECLARALHKLGSDLAESDSHFEKAKQMQRLLIAHAEDQDRHRPFLHYLQIWQGQMLVDAEKYDRANELLITAASELEVILEESPKSERRSFGGWIPMNLGLAYRSLAKLSTKLGDDVSADEWNKKFDGLRK